MIMMISEKYRGLSRLQLLEKVSELGVNYEKYSSSCSQCTVAALQQILGFEDVIVKVATSSCGGQVGFSTGACGGVIGGTIVLDYYCGRPADMVSATQSTPQGIAELSRAMEAARAFCDKFVGQYDSILCPQVQEKIYGRSFNLQDPADWKAFTDAGAHTDPTKCMRVVGNAARWALETLLDRLP
jgi:C_GCAxxG_C_C family probable redox protein